VDLFGIKSGSLPAVKFHDSLERMKERIPETSEQGLQYFISDSAWDEGPLLKKIAADAVTFLAAGMTVLFILTKQVFPKKGK
jgi:hypothetical protein